VFIQASVFVQASERDIERKRHWLNMRLVHNDAVCKLERVSGKPGLIYDGKASTTVFPSIKIITISVYKEKQFFLLLMHQTIKIECFVHGMFFGQTNVWPVRPCMNLLKCGAM
jgi:hypothetical protein